MEVRIFLSFATPDSPIPFDWISNSENESIPSCDAKVDCTNRRAMIVISMLSFHFSITLRLRAEPHCSFVVVIYAIFKNYGTASYSLLYCSLWLKGTRKESSFSQIPLSKKIMLRLSATKSNDRPALGGNNFCLKESITWWEHLSFLLYMKPFDLISLLFCIQEGCRGTGQIIPACFTELF